MIVEVDEVLLRHVRVPGQDVNVRRCIVGLACEGKVITGIVRDRTRATLHEIIKTYVAPGSTVVTDDWVSYKGLGALGFEHRTVNHSIGYFNDHGWSTCAIDSYWATLRRTLRGYRQLADHNLWLFLAEAEARYNFRHERDGLFEHLVSHWPVLNDEVLLGLQRRYDWRFLTPGALEAA